MDDYDDEDEPAKEDPVEEDDDEGSVSSDDEEDDGDDEDSSEEDPTLATVSAIEDERALPVRYRVPDDQRITSNRIQQTELVGLLCSRIKQLEGGAPCLANPDSTLGVSDARELAMLEMEQKRFPFFIDREIHRDPHSGAVYYERWDVTKMDLPAQD
jgi:hypothetical protein